MTPQIEETHLWADRIRRSEAATPKPSDQLDFFFDGEFRTWGHVEQRAQLNRALAAHISSFQLR